MNMRPFINDVSFDDYPQKQETRMPFVDDQNRSNRRDVSDSNAMTVVGVVALIVVVIIGGALYVITTRSNHTAAMIPKTEISARLKRCFRDRSRSPPVPVLNKSQRLGRRQACSVPLRGKCGRVR